MTNVSETIKKYAWLLFAFFRASAISDLEYRANLIMKIITDIIWYSAQLSVFEVLFRQTSSIGGWTIDTTRVFMGCLFVVDSVWMLIFQENLDKFSDKVRKGELDLLLAKPVNSQFMLSFQRMSTPYIFNIFMTSAYLIFAMNRLPGGPEWWRLIYLIVALPCALAITYGLRFFFSASALIFTRAENINYVWYQFYKLGTRPDSVYPPWLRYLILSAIPVAFIASVPARLLIEAPSPGLFIGMLAIAGVSVTISTRFWRFALRFYSSASS
jgi:ABC-2 type transport system permease protein